MGKNLLILIGIATVQSKRKEKHYPQYAKPLNIFTIPVKNVDGNTHGQNEILAGSLKMAMELASRDFKNVF